MYLLEIELPVILYQCKSKTLLPKAGAVQREAGKDFTTNIHLSF